MLSLLLVRCSDGTPTKIPASKSPGTKGPASKGPATGGPEYTKVRSMQRSGCKRSGRKVRMQSTGCGLHEQKYIQNMSTQLTGGLSCWFRGARNYVSLYQTDVPFSRANMLLGLLVVPKAVNREDKLSRRYRVRDLAKFERSRRYRER